MERCPERAGFMELELRREAQDIDGGLEVRLQLAIEIMGVGDVPSEKCVL